jgi:hypothetical protein
MSGRAYHQLSLAFFGSKAVCSHAVASTYRIGEAAAALGVRVETLRRWER